MAVDVLYLAWNRREFTEFSLRMLFENTDWSKVRQLIIHDDGSDPEEGTSALLRMMVKTAPCEVVLEQRKWDLRLGSPPAIMNWYIENFGDSEHFAKIDSDIVVPPGWLDALLSVVETAPEIELLGMEAGRSGPPDHNGVEWDGIYRFENGSHIGGVGLMKTEAFRTRPRMIETGGRFGFTEWQSEYKPVRGWITPDILLSELSRIPFEPWSSLSAEYVAKGWEREWPKYHERWSYWWGWWPDKIGSAS